MRNWLTQLWMLKNLSDRLSANQKPRKASGVILFESKALETDGLTVQIPFQGQEEMK